MALYAFDGTWNEDEEQPGEDTNVVRFRDIYEGPVEYRTGVGTRYGAIGRALGGLFGMGGRSRIEEMYDDLKENWQQGDKNIDIIGFSRGAALAVHFANVIAEAGIKLDNGQVEKPKIRFLGVWDIVGSFGIPINFIINFHDIDIGWNIDEVPACVEHCYHAMALDERRQTFDITRLNVGNNNSNVEEVWFRGVHGDIGGGSKNFARSSIALHWMLEKARVCGLPISQSAINLVAAAMDPLAKVSENLDIIPNPRRTVHDADQWHPAAIPTELGFEKPLTFPVRAADLYNWTGVRLKKGGHYQFDIAADQKWLDGSISCGPDGWQSEDLPWYKENIIKWFEDNRRCPEADWFELIGSLGDEGDELFRIGKGGEGRVYRAPRDGDLYAFANDLESKYENNEGKIMVTVRRID